MLYPLRSIFNTALPGNYTVPLINGDLNTPAVRPLEIPIHNVIGGLILIGFRFSDQGNGTRGTGIRTYPAAYATFRLNPIGTVLLHNSGHRATFISAGAACSAGVLVDECYEIAFGHEVRCIEMFYSSKDAAAARAAVADEHLTRLDIVRAVDKTFLFRQVQNPERLILGNNSAHVVLVESSLVLGKGHADLGRVLFAGMPLERQLLTANALHKLE